MVIRWNHLATLVVATLSVIHCEQINTSQIDVEFKDMCPCLPVEICPRVYGTKPDDAKYLGEMKECPDNNEVRCCGASSSFVIGDAQPMENKNINTPAPQSDILSRINTNDVKDNEILDGDNESGKMLHARNESAEILSLQESGNIANFHVKQHSNAETDDEASESESVVKTADAEFQYQQPTKDVQPQSGAVSSEITQKSHRQPKTLDSVMTVYPNVMSGIPKTTPRNMPETNEMTMFDQDVGMDLHLVFSKTTIKPDTDVEVQPTAEVDTTTKKSPSRFAKRRKQYRPLQRTTTESSGVDVESNVTTSTSHPATRQRIRTRNFTSRTTTESPGEGVESNVTTVTSRPATRQRIRMRNFTSRTTTQEPTESTTRQPRVRLTTRTPATKETDSTTMKPRVKLSTKAPATEDAKDAEEILLTSEDDKSQQSRFRLFNARHRLNYLRRTTTGTTAITTTTTTTTTTESPIEETTTPTVQERRKPSKTKEIPSKIPLNVRPSKMNETLILFMDANHRNMLSKVHLALKEAATENKITEIPRSFAGVETNNRLKKIERMLAEQMINVYTETKSKQRGVPAKKKDGDNINNASQSINTEQPISEQMLNPSRPNRGHKKFQMSDLLDKTPVVSISPNEFRRKMRVRTTTVKPPPVEQISEDIETPTHPRRRRPFSTIPKNNTNDVTLTGNQEGANVRRRLVIRRRYNVEHSSTSTTLSPVPHISEIIPMANVLSTTPAVSTISTETTIAPETTTLVEFTSNSSKTEVDDLEELENKPENESIQNGQESTLDTEESSVSIPATEDSDVLSDFKPSPLWSISTDEHNDFNNREDNHSYDMNMSERALLNGHRRSRNTFDAPAIYLNGFVPVSSGGDAKLRHNLPNKAQFSKS